MKLLFNKYNFKTWVILIIIFVTACVVYQKLPEQIPIHFGVSGTADSYGNKAFIFLFSGIIIALLIFNEIYRRMDPKKEAYGSFEPYFYHVTFGVSLLMLIIEVLTICIAFHAKLNVTAIMLGATGILLAFIGNMLPKFKHNYFVGIKTSWTLADEKVWYLTHRFASKIWVFGGILMILCMVIPATAAIILFSADMAVLVLVPIVASYLFYRKIHKES